MSSGPLEWYSLRFFRILGRQGWLSCTLNLCFRTMERTAYGLQVTNAIYLWGKWMDEVLIGFIVWDMLKYDTSHINLEENRNLSFTNVSFCELYNWFFWILWSYNEFLNWLKIHCRRIWQEVGGPWVITWVTHLQADKILEIKQDLDEFLGSPTWVDTPMYHYWT